MRTLNLGILAHVDAGKTTLTERLLHAAGVIDEIGSVDAGTTHTDFLDLERQRGITIKAAVVSFVANDIVVNLIDTPGHPDFIAEVERSLAVLDGAVLVISAVEGVQAQTRVFMRTLQRLRIPTLLFVNKIDRVGARESGLLSDIAERLTPSVVAMGTTGDLGSRAARFVPYSPNEIDFTALADHDDAVLTMLAGDVRPRYDLLRQRLTRQARRAQVHPVYFGSAITGAGVDVLTSGITELLPANEGSAAAPLSATVFKVERGRAGDRIAYVRLHTGTIGVRDRVSDHTITAVEVFHQGGTVERPAAVAGEIAKVWGLGSIRVGDPIGRHRRYSGQSPFAPPTLETVVSARPEDRHRLHAALTELAEQDPLIGFRRTEGGQELHLSLYGEVQKQVIAATLAAEFGIDVEFRATTPICIERPTGAGEAIETMPRGRSSVRPFLAGVGLRIEPAPIGSGTAYRDESQLGALPSSFRKAIAETVHDALQQGLYGWQVTDCLVTLTDSGYAPRQSHAHQGFSKAMSSVGSDFRLLTPLVVMAAFARAGAVVCEPIHRYELEIPVDVLSVVVPTLARLGAPPLDQQPRGAALVLRGDIRAALVHDLQQQLPDLTRGEGALDYQLDSYRPVRGTPPARVRTDNNPLNREEYLLKVLGAT